MSFAAVSRPIRYRPGVAAPPRFGAIIAAGVIGMMGFYGFATSVQKAAAVRQINVAALGQRDDARLATPTAPTPSMVYALTDGAPAPIRLATTPKARLAEPAIDPEPTVVQLAADAPADATAAVLAPSEISPALAAPAIAVEGTNATAVEPTTPVKPKVPVN